MKINTSVIKFSLALVTGMFLALAGAASADTILIPNGSFESPDVSGSGFGTTLTDWGQFGNTGNVINGRFSNFISGGDGSTYAYIANSESGIYQDVTTVDAGGAGTDYTLTAGFAISSDISLPSDEGTTTLRLVVMNATDTADALDFDTIIPNSELNSSSFDYFSVSTGVLPSEYDGREIRVVAFGNGDANNTGYFSVSTDNWTLTQTADAEAVPEPGSLALFAAGAGVLALVPLQRRRSANLS